MTGRARPVGANGDALRESCIGRFRITQRKHRDVNFGLGLIHAQGAATLRVAPGAFPLRYSSRARVRHVLLITSRWSGLRVKARAS